MGIASARVGRVGIAVVVVLVAASGCAGSRYRTSAHFDTEYEFSRVHTFAFHPPRPKTKSSEYGQILEQALRDHLVARGYEERTFPEADVMITYDLGRYAPAKLSGANSFAITEGTISVSVIDRPSQRTVWYGWVESRLRPGDDAAKVINGAVDALFADQVPDARAR